MISSKITCCSLTLPGDAGDPAVTITVVKRKSKKVLMVFLVPVERSGNVRIQWIQCCVSSSSLSSYIVQRGCDCTHHSCLGRPANILIKMLLITRQKEIDANHTPPSTVFRRMNSRHFLKKSVTEICLYVWIVSRLHIKVPRESVGRINVRILYWWTNQ